MISYISKLIIVITALFIGKIQAFSQQRDTIYYGNNSLSVDITGFKEIERLRQHYYDGYSRQYVYLREYDNDMLSYAGAAYFVLYSGYPIFSYLPIRKDYRLCRRAYNKYGGESVLSERNGLYFGYETYCNRHLSITYYNVKKDELKVFIDMLQSVILLDHM